jgi:galactose-1-phosphate uridylyltransferase
MRYHWGLGVGHDHTMCSSQSGESTNIMAMHSSDLEISLCQGDEYSTTDLNIRESCIEVGNENEYEELENDTSEHSSSEDLDSGRDTSYDDEELLELDDMYGDFQDTVLFE